MSKVSFEFPAGIEVKNKYTDFKGVIHARIERINGCVQYCVEPRCTSEKPNDLPTGYYIDGPDLVPTGKKKKFKPEIHDFRHETGDRLKSRVNGHIGICVIRRLDKNGCEHYMIEGKLNKDGEEVKKWSLLQELEKVDNGLNKKTEKPIARKRTGCSSVRADLI